MSAPVSFTKTLAAADDDIIALSQTPLAAGNLTLIGGGTVSLDTPRKVILTFAADESGHSFVVYGTQGAAGAGNPISETIAGTTAGVVASTRMYGSVTRISISAAATGAIKAGTNGVGASQWQLFNFQLPDALLSIGAVVTGTVNYSIQYTYDNFWAVPVGATQGIDPIAFTDPVLDGATATGQTSFTQPITGWRLLINSGTGSVAIRAVQAGF